MVYVTALISIAVLILLADVIILHRRCEKYFNACDMRFASLSKNQVDIAAKADELGEKINDFADREVFQDKRYEGLINMMEWDPFHPTGGEN